jgi:hypothetical protein
VYAAETNFGSRAHYIDAGGKTHCPLMKGLPPIKTWGGELGHFDQAHLDINSNTIHKNFKIINITYMISILNSVFTVVLFAMS